jgi:uncharacterized protein
MNQNRRTFLKQAGTGLVAAGLVSSTQSSSAAAEASRPAASASRAAGLPPDWRSMRKFDAHNHVFLFTRRESDSDWSDADNLVEAADALGIEKVFCSKPVTAGVMANIEVVREANDVVLAAMIVSYSRATDRRHWRRWIAAWMRA